MKSRTSRSALMAFSPWVFLIMVLAMFFWPEIERIGLSNILVIAGRFLLVSAVVVLFSSLAGLLLFTFTEGAD